MPTARARMPVIFLTVLIDLVGFGIILPILPYFAESLGVRGLGFGALIGVYSLMQFVSTAFLGRLSDRVGRRPVLLATMLINAAGYLLFAAAHSYAVLFLARVISGFAGGNISAAQAYIGDITPAEHRSRGMGVLGAAFGIGFVLGPAIGGVAGQHISRTAPLFIAAGLSLANFVSAWFVLPESLRAEHRMARPLFDFAHLADALRDRRLRPLMVVWFLAPFAFAGYTVSFPLYADAAFGWKEGQLGLYFTVVGIVSAATQGGIFRLVHRRVGDRALVLVGLAGMCASIVVIPWLGSAAALYAWGAVLAFTNSLAVPALSGLVSVLAGPAEQGTTLGAAQALASLGRFAGPEALGVAYDRAGAAAAFMGAAAVMALAGVAGLGIRPAGAEGPGAGGPAGP